MLVFSWGIQKHTNGERNCKMKTTKFICKACGHRFSEPKTAYDRHSLSEPTAYESILSCPACGSCGFEEERSVKEKKAELKQYFYLNRELQRETLKLAVMKKTDSGYNELYELVENNRLRCLALLIKTQKFIYSIDDSRTRQIFELRYIKGLTWTQTAQQMGGYVKSDTIRMIHDRYFKKYTF